jgi:hypothetical protein
LLITTSIAAETSAWVILSLILGSVTLALEPSSLALIVINMQQGMMFLGFL